MAISIGTPAVVNSTSSVDSSPGASTDFALPFTPTAGNTLVLVAAQLNNTIADIASVADDQSGTWTLLKSVFQTGLNPYRVNVWVNYSAAASVSQITANYSNNWSAPVLVQIFEFSGLADGGGRAIRFAETIDASGARAAFNADYSDSTQITANTATSLSFCVAAGIDILPGNTQLEITADSAWTSQIDLGEGGGSQNEQLVSFTQVRSSEPSDPETITLSTVNAGTLHAILVVFDAVVSPLLNLKLAASDLADMGNSAFISDTEWNRWANQGMKRLYDLLVRAFEDYFETTTTFVTVADQEDYDLPTDFYKILAVDVQISATEHYTLTPYHPNRRNALQHRWGYRMLPSRVLRYYRIVGDSMRLRPLPPAGQTIRIRYVPLPAALVAGSNEELPNNTMEHWQEYISLFMAVQALRKEETDTQELRAEMAALERNIRAAAAERNPGDVMQVANVRQVDCEDLEFGGRWW